LLSSAEYVADAVAACNTAGLNVVQALSSPVAAVIGAGLTAGAAAPQNVCVVEIGATMTVSLVSVSGGLCTLKHTVHHADIGGQLFDDILTNQLLRAFKTANADVTADPRASAKAMAKLAPEARTAKIALSNSASASVAVDSFFEGRDLLASVNRGRFEAACAIPLARISAALDSFLDAFELELDDVHALVLAGGCANTPKVAENIAEFFELEAAAAPPEEVAVMGAALQGQLRFSHG
jgi:molecular chaperone DnaK (HSP70)